ncbi:hypothetical protein Ciccas_010502 [Cichlidogyrus casuarinus]|uniref:Uncharacterized protein n=1 Tax=Cichlidogyrus casuarinus TaxID=1844966 RepID=A0ABD2PTX0_9PLAT
MPINSKLLPVLIGLGLLAVLKSKSNQQGKSKDNRSRSPSPESGSESKVEDRNESQSNGLWQRQFVPQKRLRVVDRSNKKDNHAGEGKRQHKQHGFQGTGNNRFGSPPPYTAIEHHNCPPHYQSHLFNMMPMHHNMFGPTNGMHMHQLQAQKKRGVADKKHLEETNQSR